MSSPRTHRRAPLFAAFAAFAAFAVLVGATGCTRDDPPATVSVTQSAAPPSVDRAPAPPSVDRAPPAPAVTTAPIASTVPPADAGSTRPACGTTSLPDCPLQAWMKANATPAILSGDGPALAEVLEKTATFAPAGYTNWPSISLDGARAARSLEIDAVKAACRACHDQYEQRYRSELRDRPL